MKQDTTPEQTAKLIELGFEKPKSLVDKYYDFDAEAYAEVKAYSIGELIEMLPQYIDDEGREIDIDYYSLTIRKNEVMYCDPYMDWVEILCDDHKELIDNLYDMVVKLKEEGVI